MERTCPSCGRDPGPSTRCRHCGETVYRYAIDGDDWDESAGPDGRISSDDRPPDDPPPREPDEVVVPPPPPSPPPGDRGIRATSWEALGSEDEFAPMRRESWEDAPVAPERPARPAWSPPPSRPAPTQPDPTATPAARGCRGCLVGLLVAAVVLVGLAVGLFALVGDAFEEVAGGGVAVTADPGECLDLTGDGSIVTDVAIVPCDGPHDAEAYVRQQLADGPFPGDAALATRADEVCLESFAGYVGSEYAVSEFFYDWLVPTEDGWQAGDRELVCLIVSGDGSPLVGAAFDSGR